MSAGIRFERVLLLLVGLTTVAAVLLAALEADSGRRAEQASAEGTRRAVALVSDLTGTGLALRFEVNAIRSQLELDTAANARLTLATADPLQGALARADSRAAARLAELDESSLGVRSGAEGLRATLDELAAATARQQAAVVLQNAAVDEAGRYGRRQGRAVFGLALLATAGALLGLAGVLKAGRPGRLTLGLGAAAVAAAVSSGVSALLV
jgi:hypothetical protein